jgi:hypothetical protein
LPRKASILAGKFASSYPTSARRHPPPDGCEGPGVIQ